MRASISISASIQSEASARQVNYMKMCFSSINKIKRVLTLYFLISLIFKNQSKPQFFDKLFLFFQGKLFLFFSAVYIFFFLIVFIFILFL